MNTQLAFVFPGQGSQSLGMLSELAEQYTQIGDTFAEASAVLDYDLWQLTQQGPEERLNQTEYTQVAMLVSAVAVYRSYLAQGGQKPAMMAGHSLGEYSALVCAGAIAFEDAVGLVRMRGHLMQETIPLGEGAMAAIVGLEDQAVRDICEQSAQGAIVAAANYNAIGQVVIAGHTAAVQRAVAQADEAGARLARIIPVSVPCHCDLLKPAAQAFASHLAEVNFQTPECPVIGNVKVAPFETADDIRELLTAQLYSPVRWVETIELMAAEGIETVVECGPGKVLSGLIKRINRSIKSTPVSDIAGLEKSLSL